LLLLPQAGFIQRMMVP